MNTTVSRRRFAMGMAAAGGAYMVAATTPHFAQAEETPSQAEPAGASGNFTASAQGYGGPVTVTLAIEGNQLLGVEVEGDLETQGVGSRAVRLMPYRMMAAGTVDVDGISGATVTSAAIRLAASEVLEQAGVELVGEPLEVVQVMTPGVYECATHCGKWKEGTVEGNRFFSPEVIEPTHVKVEVDGEKILSVEVLSCSDTPGYVEPSSARMSADVVAQQSVACDVVTGCTMTCGAILESVADCLEQAGADLMGFVAPTVHTDGEEEYDVDFCIVGSGGAGTMAALTCVENGISCVVLEKCGKVAGLSSCASSLLCVESDLQIEAGERYDLEEQYAYQMDFAHWKANGPLVHRVLEVSAGVVNKLDGLYKQTDEVGFERVNKGRPCVAQRKGTGKIQALYDQFIVPGGGQLLMECAAKSLIVNEDGKVCGVNAQKKDGTKVTVRAKGVLVATGGFGGNKAMLDEICGSHAFYLNGVSQNCGDGVNMVRAIGGHVDPETIPEFSEYCGNDQVDIFSGYLKYCNQPGFLTVNSSGERFVNEQMFMSSILTNAGPCLAAAGCGYLVFTQGNVDAMVEKGIQGVLSDEDLQRLTLNEQQYSRVNHPGYPTLASEIETCIAHNQAWKADTLEDLGAQAGFNAEVWAKTLEEYLACVDAGEDIYQGKDPAMLHPLAEGPFYAVRITPTIFGTLCGIKVASNCQALDDDFRIIEGLYMGGQDAGGYFVSPYYSDAAGHSCGFAWHSGYIAAKHFIENYA